MERERAELERYSNLEAKLHLEQQKRKQEVRLAINIFKI